MPTDLSQLSEQYLMYFIVPLWLAAGVADWVMHRRAGIEHNSGPKESMIHLLMLAEMGLPVLAALFLQVNALVLLFMIAAFFVHEATAMWDVSYAVTRRVVTPLEQHIHSFLEMLPLMAVSMVALLHWPQFTALLGIGPEAADFSLRWKESPLPRHYVVWLMVAIVLFELLPYGEEFLRTLRGRYQRKVQRTA
ncbi:diguanylate cyclase [Duganella sp.]|uniref:diguanylate cyclase n=1 Tax=Duganella sp. TaxID=1904440 RepID=UPI0031E2AC5C